MARSDFFPLAKHSGDPSRARGKAEQGGNTAETHPRPAPRFLLLGCGEDNLAKEQKSRQSSKKMQRPAVLADNKSWGLCHGVPESFNGAGKKLELSIPPPEKTARKETKTPVVDLGNSELNLPLPEEGDPQVGAFCRGWKLLGCL